MPTPQPTAVGPLTGVLDLRSSPEEIPLDALRMRQNFRTTGQGKLRRGNGYEKLLNTADYNNSDFHDQLLSLSTYGTRQPVLSLFEAVNTRQVRSLFLATQGTIAQLNAFSGNYRILGSGFGGTPSASGNAPRFKFTQQGDYAVMTNDFDRPKYCVLEQAADSGVSLHEFDDLVTIGLRRARLAWVWHSIVIFANVEMDGERAGYRLVWGDFDNPTSFDPANLDSIAGLKDLYTYETILAGAPFGNSFLIYTTHGIWEMVADPDKIFDFRRVYDGEKDNLKAVLQYPNTLVPIHDGHAYMGADGVYFFSQYYPMPDRPEWLHRGTADMYSSIDANSCDAHVGTIYGDEILFSIARKDATNQLPDYTLRINKTYKVADVVDDGFSAFCQFSPMQVATIRDFIVENKICTIAGLATAGYPYGKEGLPRVLPTGSAEFTPAKFYSDVTQTVADVRGGTITVEDWTQANASADSLCALLAGERLDEICRACKPLPLLVAASSSDWCLKQLTDVFYREQCLNPTAVGVTDGNGYTAAVGSYQIAPIVSILRFAAATMADAKVIMERLELKYLAVDQVTPLNMSLRVGISGQPADANTGEGIVWFQHSAKPLKFQTGKTMAEHLAANTIPSDRMLWSFYREGRFIHVELSLSGVGGDSLFGSIESGIRSGGRTVNC